MRLVELRAGLAGKGLLAGWFDLQQARLPPPLGYDVYWSRLIDAGLAGLLLIFKLAVDPLSAERLMRACWPLLWLLPTIAGMAAIAWRLAGREAATVVHGTQAQDAGGATGRRPAAHPDGGFNRSVHHRARHRARRCPDSVARPASRHCFRTASYAALARLPAGLVVTDISYGSFVLAPTPHSAMTAPYHRLSRGIVIAHGSLAAPPDEARRILTDAKVSYVMVCGSRPLDGLPEPARSRSLWGRLQAGAIPDWLAPVPGTLPFAVYRVRPCIVRP
jgi:hypothetical protein